MTRVRRSASAVTLIFIVAAVGVGCTARPPDPQRHPLPRLPALGSVMLPGGFVAYDEPTAPYAARHPIHVDSAFFERYPSDDIGGNHHCGAQVTVSPYDPQIVTPAGYTKELSTKLCDADWFATQFDESWRLNDPADPNLWTVQFLYSEVGWFGVTNAPASGVVLFVPERGLTVGVWAKQDVYSLDETITLARETARSVG